ncbi:MAG: hypothetical protein K0S76_2612 [Herbinix sp.]|nr:hypothetical protein [Herbinix sp.]
MIFTDICFISRNVLELATFYCEILNVDGDLNGVHSYIEGPGLNIAIYDQEAAERDGMDFSDAGRGYAYIGFNVEDVDKEFERLKLMNVRILSQPQVWPWGAKSFRFLDPDGNKIVFRSLPQ